MKLYFECVHNKEWGDKYNKETNNGEMKKAQWVSPLYGYSSVNILSQQVLQIPETSNSLSSGDISGNAS